jgi:hypothetical protein
MLDMWQLAPLPSVALMASTQPSNRRARRNTSSGSAESGGSISAVMAKVPLRSTRSRRPGEVCPGRMGSG